MYDRLLFWLWLPCVAVELSLSEADKEQLAERERIKGNEVQYTKKTNFTLPFFAHCIYSPHSLQEFRSSGFKEALHHYTRSVALHPTTAALNNRALTCELLMV